MKKNLKLYAPHLIIPRGMVRTHDVAFTYRMPAGFAGDVNRTHPASIEPAKLDPTNPPTFVGQAVLADATNNSVKAFGVSDDSALTEIYGVTVRSYPIQQMSGGLSASFGSGGIPSAQPVDVLKSGYILVPVVGTPAKGGAVFVWGKPTSGSNIQGGFQAAANAGNNAALDPTKYMWNGPPDANGLAELVVRP